MRTKASADSPAHARRRRLVARASAEKTRGARRGRPPRVGREVIVQAALDLGLETASMRAIAERLGVTTPALYGHVAGLAQVRALAATRLMDELEVPRTTDWREWLREFGRRARRDLGRAGRALRVDLSGPLDLRRLGVAEEGLAMLIRAGFRPGDAGRAVWLVARVAVTAGPGGAASVHAPIREAQRVSAALPGASTAHRRYPAMTRAIAQLTKSRAADTFEFDLDVVISGLERVLDGLRSRAGPGRRSTT